MFLLRVTALPRWPNTKTRWHPLSLLRLVLSHFSILCRPFFATLRTLCNRCIPTGYGPSHTLPLSQNPASFPRTPGADSRAPCALAVLRTVAHLLLCLNQHTDLTHSLAPTSSAGAPKRPTPLLVGWLCPSWHSRRCGALGCCVAPPCVYPPGLRCPFWHADPVGALAYPSWPAPALVSRAAVPFWLADPVRCVGPLLWSAPVAPGVVDPSPRRSPIWRAGPVCHAPAPGPVCHSPAPCATHNV